MPELKGSRGAFGGKNTYASTGSKVFYLTQKDFKTGSEVLRVPAMSARAAGDAERCILYTQADGTLRVQLPTLLWISLLPDLGWLTLSENPAGAVPIRMSAQPDGQRWEVLAAGVWQRVYYSVDQASPILGINGGEGVPDTFTVAPITPSLQVIRDTKNGQGADLRFVDLTGETLDGINFTKADFSRGNAERASFPNSILTEAKFVDSRLIGIRCEGTTLDKADMTRAILDGASWGTPKSAAGIILTSCSAKGATLGAQAAPLNCADANLASGDFRNANLTGLLLNRAKLNGAILAGCKLNKAVLDNAKLTGAIAVGASFVGASLKGTEAQGASLTRADLTNADLTRAQLGARAWLFDLTASTFVPDLQDKKFVQPPLIDAFKQQGVTLLPADAVTIVEPGKRWTISDPNGPYALILNAAGKIDIFWASPDLRPATLRGAICRGTKAPGASLAGADLRGVSWYSQPATLDHADLEGAVLSGSQFVQTSFSQAYLSGADLSNCVLVQADFSGCLLTSGDSRRPFSLEGSILAQANFAEATLVGALLTDAVVALPRGIPLFRLPKSLEPDLVAEDLAKLAPEFSKAGFPLGADSRLSKSSTWLLDNQKDTTPSAPRLYRIRLARTNLQVLNANTGATLFQLDGNYEQYLSRATASPELVAAFGQNQYSLILNAPIQLERYWQIDLGADVLGKRAVSYPLLRIYIEAGYLPVYASVKITMRDWSDYSSGLAFSATSGLEAALNPASISPSGYPRSWFDNKLLDWESLMTIGG
jgi:uncharacterized protein YjbI with pentapeptide repeats